MPQYKALASIQLSTLSLCCNNVCLWFNYFITKNRTLINLYAISCYNSNFVTFEEPKMIIMRYSIHFSENYI